MFTFRRLLILALTSVVLTAGSRSLAVPAEGHKIMYAGPSPYGPEIARDIHGRGGNAVDVAVAVALSLSVTHPYFASLGGGGFAIVKVGKEVKALDFRETAPARAHPDVFKTLAPEDSRHGGLAVGVPGVPAGLWDLHHKYGRLKWNRLFDEAIRLAEKGFRVSGEWVEVTSRNRMRFNDSGRNFFFRHSKDHGEEQTTELKPGELLKQPQLAVVLRALRGDGPKAFYEGKTAKEIVDTINGSGGIYSLNDLKNYRTRWLEPLTTDFGGYHLSLMPPPSSGGVVIAAALKLVDMLKLKEQKPLSTDEFHLLAEVMKLSFRGRQLLGDPAFAKNPVAQLLDDHYLEGLAAQVKPDKSVAVEPLKEISFEHENTTHFSVVDTNGDAVAFTVTLNGFYGSGLVSSRSGIALNNEIDDFTTKIGQANMFGLMQGEANLVRAGARPLSSMSPTIVEKDGRTVLAVGAPGGPRITTAVLQVLYRVLAQNLDIDQAIQTPREHHQFLPDIIYLDAHKFSPEVVAGLEKRGHKVEVGSTGRVYGVVRDANGLLSGAGDSRGECAAGGL